MKQKLGKDIEKTDIILFMGGHYRPNASFKNGGFANSVKKGMKSLEIFPNRKYDVITEEELKAQEEVKAKAEDSIPEPTNDPSNLAPPTSTTKKLAFKKGVNDTLTKDSTD